MIALVQRVTKARVQVASATFGRSVAACWSGVRRARRARRARRPRAAGRSTGPAQGRALYDAVLRVACERHPVVAAGEFGADMQTSLVNDGPVTSPLRIT